MSIYIGTQVIPTPGNLQNLLAQGDAVNKAIESLGGCVCGTWQITLGEGVGTLALLVSYPDLAAYQAATQKAQTDPTWQKMLADFDPMIAGMNSAIYTPTPNSPMQ